MQKKVRVGRKGGLVGGGGWLAVVGGVGYGVCKPRIEGIVKCS